MSNLVEYMIIKARIEFQENSLIGIHLFNLRKPDQYLTKIQIL